VAYGLNCHRHAMVVFHRLCRIVVFKNAQRESASELDNIMMMKTMMMMIITSTLSHNFIQQ